MPIAYTTGTINQPDAGSVGQAMVERIRDDVSAHAAWDLVEEFTAASGAVRWYVLKCLASASGLPNDYFIVIGRTLSNGELRFAICEGYDAASHTMSLFPQYSSNNNVQYDANGRNPATLVLGAAAFTTGGAAPKYQNWIPAGTSTKWWITVDSDGFTVAFNGPSNGFVHCGAYTPLTSLPILTPVQMIGSSDTYGGITNNPAVANILATAYALSIAGGGYTGGAFSYAIPLGFPGDLRYNDKLQGGSRPVAEIGMTVVANFTGDQAVTGWALGKQKRMRGTSQQVPAGMAFGDAYVLAGRLWVPFSPTDGRMWDTGVASS
jgi:hypothetical protein